MVRTAYLAQSAAGSDGRVARGGAGEGRGFGYLYRRMCTFCTRPISAKNVTSPEPP